MQNHPPTRILSVVLVYILELELSLLMFGAFVPMIFELLIIIYHKQLMANRWFFLKALTFPVCSMTLAAMMSKEWFDIMDRGNDNMICMLIFYHMFYLAGYTDEQTHTEWREGLEERKSTSKVATLDPRLKQ